MADHCYMGTPHCDCPETQRSGICCHCRKQVPPRKGHDASSLVLPKLSQYAPIMPAHVPSLGDYTFTSYVDANAAFAEGTKALMDKALTMSRKETEEKMRKAAMRRTYKEDEMLILSALKSYDAETTTLDEMVSLLACGDMLTKTYEANDLETPGWVVETVASLRSRVAALAVDNREKALRDINLELEKLKTRDEKKDELLKKQTELLRKLGKPEPQKA